jgi:hypothetical protein
MRRIAALVFLLAVVGVLSWWYSSRSQPITQLPPVDYSTVLLIKPYSNDQFKFSLSMPGNFEARQLADDGSGASTILLESTDRADGVQIIVSPFDEEMSQLTKERIQQDVPDLTITDPQPVEIGANNTGLAFKSDNEAFDGASREVWFVFRGHLYQISTYDRLDPLLKKIFSTWKFF